MFGYLFIIVSIVTIAIIFIKMAGDLVVPLTCPRCFRGGDRDAVGRYRAWYWPRRGGGIRCRFCRTRFKMHPNGNLVKDDD